MWSLVEIGFGVAFTLHQVINFAAPKGEETFYGDQIAVKQCYLTTVSVKAMAVVVWLWCTKGLTMWSKIWNSAFLHEKFGWFHHLGLYVLENVELKGFGGWFRAFTEILSQKKRIIENNNNLLYN